MGSSPGRSRQQKSYHGPPLLLFSDLRDCAVSPCDRQPRGCCFSWLWLFGLWSGPFESIRAIISTPYTGLFIAASCNSRSRFNSGTPVSRNRIMVRLLPEKNFSFQSTCAYLCYLLRPRALRPMRITNLGVSIFRLHASTSLCSAPIVFRNCLLEIPRDNCRDTPALACVRWTRTFEQRPPASSFENPRWEAARAVLGNRRAIMARHFCCFRTSVIVP